MKMILLSWLVALLLTWAGCQGGAPEPRASARETAAEQGALASEPLLSGKDIRLTLALVKQEKDGIPGAFRVTFENTSDHRGVLTLPAPMPGRPAQDSWDYAPPSIGILITASDGREKGLPYTDIRATRAGRAERAVLAPGEKIERAYDGDDLYVWMADGPADGGRFTKCIKAGKDEVQVRAVMSAEYFRTEEETAAKGARVFSEPVTMHCSLSKKLFMKPERPSPLMKAVQDEDVAAVQRLLAEGADVNDGGESQGNWTPLQGAVIRGNAQIVKILLDRGANLNVRDKYGHTPLHDAAFGGHADVAGLLLEKGADVNAKNRMGCTPLHRAADRGELEVAQVLLAKGADPNCETGAGRTPLDEAVFGSHKEMAALLLEKGADVNGGRRGGDTPLHSAALYGDAGMVELLLSKNADVNSKDARGHTALNIAEELHEEECARVLREHGAKE